MDKKQLNAIIRSKVKSSNILSIGYKEQYLTIEFNNHRVYAYHPITQECHEELIKAKSHGKYFFEKIRNNENVTTTEI